MRSRSDTLYRRLHFADYLAKCATDSAYTIRQHLRKRDGAIEE